MMMAKDDDNDVTLQEGSSLRPQEDHVLPQHMLLRFLSRSRLGSHVSSIRLAAMVKEGQGASHFATQQEVVLELLFTCSAFT